MRMKSALEGGCLTAMALALNVTSPALAQPAAAVVAMEAAETMERPMEIVVTGSRLRDESVQETPIAVSVIGADTVANLHAADARALTSEVPNLYVAQATGNVGVPLVSMRGFGVFGSDVGVEPGIAIYIDGIYQATLQGALSDLFDAERVEVLRGPQSTLLGKNASAGAILVTRTRPNVDDYSMKLQLDYGTYNLAQAQALVNVPVVPGVLGAKIFGSYRHRDGYYRNLTTGTRESGEQVGSLRGALRFTPSASFDLYLSADWQHNTSDSSGSRVINPTSALPCVEFGVCTNDQQPRITRSNFPGGTDYTSHSYVANGRLSFSGMRLTSITGYHTFESTNNYDIDQGPLTLLHAVDQKFDIKDFSQEVRLSSEDGGLDMDGRLAWMVGGYYSRSNAYQFNPLQVYIANGLGTGPTVNLNQSTRLIRQTKALFGHVDFDILRDQLTLSLGVRHSWDKVTHHYGFPVVGPTLTDPGRPFTQSADFENTSYEAGLQYQFDPTKMVYFRYAEGYRGGGFPALPASAATNIGFQPETSQSYEVGLRTEFFDRKLLFNVTAFSTTYDDLQRSTNLPAGTSFVTVTFNAAKARIRGLEVEATARPFDGFQIRGSLGYTDPKYLSYISAGTDLTDQPFPTVAKWTYNITPTLKLPLADSPAGINAIELQASVEHRSTAYLTASFLAPNFAAIPEYFEPGYTTVDAQIALLAGADDNLRLTAYVQNLFDKDYGVFGVNTGALPTLRNIMDNPGRIFGVSLGARF